MPWFEGRPFRSCCSPSRPDDHSDSQCHCSSFDGRTARRLRTNLSGAREFLPRRFDFGVYPARFIDICRFQEWLCHAGVPLGRWMVFAYFVSFCLFCGLRSSCLVLLSSPRFLLLPRKLRRRRTTRRTQLRSLRNAARNRHAIPSLRAPLPAVIAPPTIRSWHIPAKGATRDTRVTPARKRRRVLDAIVTMSLRGNWRGPISSTMRLSRPLNCGPWRSS